MNKSLKISLLFLLFLVLTLLVYSPTLHSKFVFDFVDLFFDFKNKGWSSLASFSKGLSPDFIARSILYGLIEIFGLNERVWFFVSSLLHALNALLFFLLIKQLLHVAGYTQIILPSVLSALLFLFSPFQTEAVVWGGAMNYLVVSFFILLHLNTTLYWLVSKKPWSLYCAALTFFLAMFSHEWGLFLLPADLLLLFLIGDKQKKKYFLFVVTLFVLIGIYFLNQWLSGEIIGHYGAETHLRFKWQEIVPAFYRYIFKATLLPGFVFEQYQAQLYSFLLKPKIVLLLVGITLSAVAFIGFLFLKNKQKNTPVIFLLLLFCIFIFPVLNLYFPYWIKIHADRYCYLPLPFLYAAAICFLFQFKTIFRIVLPVVFIICSVICLMQINKNWNASGRMITALEKNFPTDTTKHYYILNLPDNYNGAYMFRCLGKSKLAQYIKMKTAMDRNEQITEILSYNLQTENDSVFVTALDSTRLKVELSHWGNWWWRFAESATAYTNDKFKIEIDDYSHSYVVTFKQKETNDIFLYQAGNEWREVRNF